jgi:uncharacterized protein (DUF2249 family)
MTLVPVPPDVTRLDVRTILAAGGEPLDLILTTAGQMAPGGTLQLTAPFEPVPLYAVMQRRGFSRTTEARGPAEWVVTFRDTGIPSTATLAAIAERYPAAREVLGRHGLDLCCGGAKTLAFAASAHGLNLDGLLGELHGAVIA